MNCGCQGLCSTDQTGGKGFGMHRLAAAAQRQSIRRSQWQSETSFLSVNLLGMERWETMSERSFYLSAIFSLFWASLVWQRGKLDLCAFDSPPPLFFSTVSLKSQEIPSVTSSQKGCYQTPSVPQTRPYHLLHLKIIMVILYTASALCLQGLFPLIPVRSIL